MKRGAAAVAAGALALGVAAIPVGAVMVNQQSQDSGAAQDVRTTSDLGLAGTGAAFLLVGAGTLGFAHRRRWATIDGRAADSDSPAGTVTPSP